MGLANWLTVLRILLIPVFVSLLVYRKPGPALVVFVAAALTDLLDGYVARHHGLSSRLGAFLDPMADKLLLVSSFVTLTWLKALPFWIAAVVISRDLILMVGALVIHMAGGRIYPRPTRAGKIATFFQILTVLTGLATRFVPVGPARGSPCASRATAPATRCAWRADPTPTWASSSRRPARRRSPPAPTSACSASSTSCRKGCARLSTSRTTTSGCRSCTATTSRS